ncbi:MAG: hypothetical protein UY31_C0072G0003 [Candidatus Wolfebacteria bacterium GW2011_GWE1_48_7]|nr:MAG: hypothetical protein UY31_C0072G0003 [Candidatus Wolfebacteria bacterium GW2011_GWE1_48_7]
MDVTLVSFGYEGLMKIKDAAKAQGNTTEGMVKGLTSIFGEDKSADRIEKIYRVVEGKKIEM